MTPCAFLRLSCHGIYPVSCERTLPESNFEPAVFFVYGVFNVILVLSERCVLCVRQGRGDAGDSSVPQ